MTVQVSSLLSKMITNQGLAQELDDQISAVMRRTAKMALDWVKVYAPQPPINPAKVFWLRGVGKVRILKNGVTRIYTRSEVLHSKWAIDDFNNQQIIYNVASYSGIVHLSEIQPPYHKQHGWRNERGMIRYARTQLKRNLGGSVIKLMRRI